MQNLVRYDDESDDILIQFEHMSDGASYYSQYRMRNTILARELATNLLKAADDMDKARTEYGEYFKRKERE